MAQFAHTQLIIVVTGANGGVGFGVCHRLLVQLSEHNPPDATPRFDIKLGSGQGEFEYNASAAGVNIILACRDLKRADDARAALYGLLDAHIASLPEHSVAREYALEFRKKVQLETHKLDLSETRSVLQFGREVSQKYPYISHLICNAGVAKYSHLDFPKFFRQCFESPTGAIHHPAFNIQKTGTMSTDGLGYVWQCNVFGHYALFRSIQPLLSKYSSKSSTPPRVLWTTSIDVLPAYNPADDWQLTKTDASYQASKFQLDLMSRELARRSSEDDGKVVHVLVSPGITATKMAAELLRPVILEWLMLLFFYFCRLLGSPNVLFSTYKAAIAASNLTLLPIEHIPRYIDGGAFPKFSAQNDRWGTESIGVEAVTEWEDHPGEGKEIVDRCERLYKAFVGAECKTNGVGNGVNGVNGINGASVHS
ncbi:hypothetical protein POSPLADRAFT_1041828 [Postia placenta MAD-698-R-SB12]|uniref:3beta-hydroxysteroid 3-dehydrogenase n=1 Tax=Postia placenta MAD-698-R-SB12 TaxID=670580 RepID=A0A1X6MKT9_9APHY|nr:hypothetical protein POSPLADRAFT_1041828 [Postia placenta MAD-698-R-SB12]OSX57027.1 hypothetical protein POSPLADRAFT_1041828 [Postia placenta MAD-698-R-SB12]